MPHKIPPELLSLIIPHLRRPLSPTHTVIRPPRSTLKQPDLVSTLTVCSDWYLIASRVLYTVVITQSLPLLIRGLDDHPIRDIPSKRALLGRIKHLYLEPADLLDAAAGPTKGDDAKVRDDWEAVVCVSDHDTPVFPSLQTLSVGAFSGSTQLAEQNKRRTVIEWDYVDAAYAAVGMFLLHHSQLQHICDWGVGPLILDSEVLMGASGSECDLPSLALHTFGIRTVLRSQTTWVPIRRYIHPSPPSLDDGITHLGANHEAVLHHVLVVLQDRQRLADYHREPDKADVRWDFDESLHITLPPDDGDVDVSTEEGRAVWRKQADLLQEDVRELLVEEAEDLPDWYKPRDSWTVSQLFDAPRCEACGWEPAEAEVGGGTGVELEI